MKRQHHGMRVNTEGQWPPEDIEEKTAIQHVGLEHSERGTREPSQDSDRAGLAFERYHQVIAEMAYGFWERRGHAHGADVADWLNAEASLKSLGPAERALPSKNSTSANTGKL